MHPFWKRNEFESALIAMFKTLIIEITITLTKTRTRTINFYQTITVTITKMDSFARTITRSNIATTELKL